MQRRIVQLRRQLERRSREPPDRGKRGVGGHNPIALRDDMRYARVEQRLQRSQDIECRALTDDRLAT